MSVETRRTGSVWSSDVSRLPPAESDPGQEPCLPDGRFINRELSWLEFGARLLSLASDRRSPCWSGSSSSRSSPRGSTSSSRSGWPVSRIRWLQGCGPGRRTDLSPRQQLDAITAVPPNWSAGRAGYSSSMAPALTDAGVGMSDWYTLGRGGPCRPDDVFERQIFPILTPLAVDQGHPFPYISDLSLNLVMRVRNAATGEERIARVKVPPSSLGSSCFLTSAGSCRSSRSSPLISTASSRR